MKRIAFIAAASALAASAHAQVVNPALGFIGHVTPRSSTQLAAAGLHSTFGVGGETTDRDYSTFSLWQPYLAPLGVTKLRVQSGWNDIEKTISTPAVYNFAKLDAIVDGANAVSVRPWVMLGYGNANAGCTDCGTAGLGATLPTGAGLQRFLDFVGATVTRYNVAPAKVTDWEIWNEPDGHVDATAYAQLAVATAQKIKSIQPSAHITIGSFTTGVLSGPTSTGYAYAKTVLDYFDANKGPTVLASDVSVAYHPYWGVPDYDANAWFVTGYGAFTSLVTSKGYTPRQGEGGAPSTACSGFALCGPAQWDETNQAKWDLRRVLSDFNLGLETNLFTLVDLHYDWALNTKGLLATGVFDASKDSPTLNGDQTIHGKKMAYGAYQNVTAVFDSRLQHVNGAKCTAPYGYTVQPWTRNDAGIVRNMLVIWNRTTELPTTGGTTPITINCAGFHFPRYAQNTALVPRYADLLDGRVYQMQAGAIVTGNSASSNSVTLTNVPVGDWPVVVADQGIVLFSQP